MPKTTFPRDDDSHRRKPNHYDFDEFDELTESEEELLELNIPPDVFRRIEAFRARYNLTSEKLTKAKSRGFAIADRLNEEMSSLSQDAVDGVSTHNSLRSMGKSEAALRQLTELETRNKELSIFKQDLLFPITRTALKKALPWIAACVAIAFALYLMIGTHGNSSKTISTPVPEPTPTTKTIEPTPQG